MPELRVFLSAVSSEFRGARNALTDDFGARDVLVKVQEQFLPDRNVRTLLEALDDYISSCRAVICVIGKRSGACPKPDEVAKLPGVLPDGVAEASYTQWEYYLTRHHGKECLLYIAQNDYEPDDKMPSGADFPDLQQKFVTRIKGSGLHYDSFASTHELCRRIGLHRWPQRIPAEARSTHKPILLPYPSLGTLFKGRDAFLRQLRDSLTRPDGGAAAITSNAIHGLGGIGKTRAAVEYAWKFHDDYTALLLVVAETPDGLRRNLAMLTSALGLIGLETADDTVRRQAVMDCLYVKPGWLLILDSVDSKEALAEVTAQTSRLTRGHVLLTGRLANLPAEFEPLALDVLRLEDAAAFLLERTHGRRRQAADDAVKARELAEELGQLALALEHAGAYIAQDRATFAEYLALLRVNFDSVMAWSDPAITHYPRSIAATWRTSVNQLGKPARLLLEVLAFLAPDPVPELLLEVALPDLPAAGLRQALANLAEYSLVTRDAERPEFLVHRLVQDVTRRSLGPTASRARLEKALDWLNAAFVGNPQDVRSWPRFDPLAPHAGTVARYADAAGIAAPTVRLMGEYGLLLHAKAQYAEAEPLMRRALEISEAGLSNDQGEVATNLNNLAQLLQETNRLGEAEPLMRRALAITEASSGPNHPSVATRLSNLAALLKDTNRLADAEPLMRRALTIDEASLGKDPLKVAIRLNNLALLLQETNRLTEAESLYRRALAIDQMTLGDDHPEIAADLNNLAVAIEATGRVVEAETMYRRAIAIDEASLGKHHPTVAIRLSNLAHTLQAMNRFAEAEPLMRRALAIDEASLGDVHPSVAIRLRSLARLLQAADRLDEAEPLMRRELAIFLAHERATGHAHRHLDAAIGNYTDLLGAMGKSAAEIQVAIQDYRNGF